MGVAPTSLTSAEEIAQSPPPALEKEDGQACYSDSQVPESSDDLRAVMPTEREHDDQTLVTVTPNVVIEPGCFPCLEPTA
jgi:hypothetical protein